jgi:hypothetical protein
VLARAAPQDKNSHYVNTLRIEIGLHALAADGRVISLTLTRFAPRIRACRDSLAYLHQLPPAKGV